MKHRYVLLFDSSRKYRGTPCEGGCGPASSVNSFVEGKHQPFHSLLSVISGVNGMSPATTLIATNHSFCLLTAPYVNRRCTPSPLSGLFLPNTISTPLDFMNAAIWTRSKEWDITHLCICRLLNRYSPPVLYFYISCTFPPAWNVLFCLVYCNFDQGTRSLKKKGFKQFPFKCIFPSALCTAFCSMTCTFTISACQAYLSAAWSKNSFVELDTFAYKSIYMYVYLHCFSYVSGRNAGMVGGRKLPQISFILPLTRLFLPSNPFSFKCFVILPCA